MKQSAKVQSKAQSDAPAGAEELLTSGDEILANVAAVFNNAGDDNIVVRVVQCDEKGTADLFDVDPDDVLDIFERVRREFGSGKYQVVTYRNGKFAGRYTFRVKVPGSWRAPRPQSEAPAQDGTLAALIARMDERQQRSEERMLALMERMAQPAPAIAASDPFALTEKVLALVTTITSATGGSKGDNALDLIMKGVELRDKVAGASEGGGGGIIDLIREAIPPLAEVAGEIAKARAAAPVPAIAAAPAARVPAPALPDAGRLQLEFLLQRAAANGDPDLAAGNIEEIIPAAMLGQLLAQSDPVAAFAQATGEPRILGFRPWFQAVVDILREPGDDEEAMPAEDGAVPVANGTGNSQPVVRDRAPVSPASAAGRAGPRGRNSRDAQADAPRRSPRQKNA